MKRLALIATALISLFISLALPAYSSAAHGEARQLRGAMLTPNWSAKESPFFQTPADQQAEIAAVRAMGGTVVRLDVDWARLQPEQGGEVDADYQAQLDAALGAAHANGLAVILNVTGTPCWASLINQTCPLQPVKPYWTDHHMDPPDAPSFGEVVRHLTTRYRPYALEVWNEPNLGKFWNGTPSQFAAIVNAAVASAGQTRVIVGGFFIDGGDFLRQAYAAGMRGQDGISIHPYAFSNPKGRKSMFNHWIRSARKIQRAHRDRSGLYITEYGYATCPATPCTPNAGRWLAESFRQAEQYRWLKAVVFFSMHDYLDPDVPVPFWDRRCGVVGKPAFGQVRRTLTQLRKGH